MAQEQLKQRLAELYRRVYDFDRAYHNTLNPRMKELRDSTDQEIDRLQAILNPTPPPVDEKPYVYLADIMTGEVVDYMQFAEEFDGDDVNTADFYHEAAMQSLIDRGLAEDRLSAEALIDRAFASPNRWSYL